MRDGSPPRRPARLGDRRATHLVGVTRALPGRLETGPEELHAHVALPRPEHEAHPRAGPVAALLEGGLDGPERLRRPLGGACRSAEHEHRRGEQPGRRPNPPGPHAETVPSSSAALRRPARL